MGFLFCALQCLVFILIQRLLRVASVIALLRYPMYTFYTLFFCRFSLRLFSSILSSSTVQFHVCDSGFAYDVCSPLFRYDVCCFFTLHHISVYIDILYVFFFFGFNFYICVSVHNIFCVIFKYQVGM